MTDSSVTKPEPQVNPAGKSSSKAARDAKRLKWWMENMEKRLSFSEGKPEATIPYNDRDKPEGGFAKSQIHRRGPGNNRKAKKLDGSSTQNETPKKDDGKSVKKTRSVFVGHIPFTAKEEDVRKLFETVGKIKHFRWRTHSVTKKFLGFAFVEFENKQSYLRAFRLHHTLVDGKPINVEATLAGGKKSKHRADAIKQTTLKLQKAAAESLKRKEKISVGKPTSKKLIAKESAEVAEEDVIKLPAGDRVAAPKRKREVDEVNLESAIEKKPPSETLEITTDGAKDPKPEKTKKPRLAADLPILKKMPSDSKNPNVAPLTKPQQVLIVRPPQPKEPHLAALGQKRNHIKFESDG